MSTWPIPPLTPKDLDFAVKNYDFTTLTGNELAELPSDLDLIDSLLADFGTSVADQTVLIASMADDLSDLPNILSEIDTDDFETIAAELAGIAAAGDALLSSYFS